MPRLGLPRLCLCAEWHIERAENAVLRLGLPQPLVYSRLYSWSHTFDRLSIQPVSFFSLRLSESGPHSRFTNLYVVLVSYQQRFCPIIGV